MRYPRIDIIKWKHYEPFYHESYEVRTLRPKRPMVAKYFSSMAQANTHAKRELARLKKEGYDKAVYSSMMINLKRFIH